MAYLYRKTIHDIFHTGVKFFERITQRIKNTVHHFIQGMEPPVKTTLAQNMLAQSSLLNILERTLMIPSKIQARNNSRHQYFCITHCALFVFMVFYGFQIIVQKTINCNRIVYHLAGKVGATSLSAFKIDRLCSFIPFYQPLSVHS
jgi:hypothetical protein